MRYSIDQVMAVEIKRDIANRYFGFRKLIEEDTLDLKEKVSRYKFILEKRIGFDLLRIYCILGQDELIRRFLVLLQLDQTIFYDPVLAGSEQVLARVFAGIHPHGLTRKQRLIHLLFECYERLESHGEQYRRLYLELSEEQAQIADEIREFYRNNELGTILGFLNSLGQEPLTPGLSGAAEPGLVEALEERLRIAPPLPVEQYLPVLPPLPALAQIGPDLRSLAIGAYLRHRPETLTQLVAVPFLARWFASFQDKRFRTG